MIPVPATPVPATPETPPTFLIVDDDRGVRGVLSRLLRQTGATVFEADRADEALLLLSQHNDVALVMSDIQMPGMDGIELLGRILAQWPDIGVVMISGFDDVEIAVRCLSLGAMDYLSKPFHVEEVRARVNQALEKRRLVLEQRRLTIENRIYQERLAEKVTVQARRLEQLFLASVQSLADALEAKDPYTRGHSDRVSGYAVVIATELGVDEETMRQVQLGGHVHDIGKIGVHEAVLHKPGKLTEDEYAHVMTHPMLGWRILGSLLDEAPIALSIVRSHHERYDGRGLPDGLSGNAIPLEARITAVADSFDAMTSDRPYRPEGMSIDAAVREVVRCSATQFDPEVVVAFLSAVESGRLSLLPRTPSYVGPPVA
jgi:putative two-component system response regulator